MSIYGLRLCAHHGMLLLRASPMYRSNSIYTRTSAFGCVQAQRALQHASSHPHLPVNWQFDDGLRVREVWNGFILLCLLEDCEQRSTRLHVPNSGSARDRFKSAIQARNTHIHINGQPEKMHRCDDCTRYYDFAADGRGIGTYFSYHRV